MVCHLNDERMEPIVGAPNPWCREHLKINFLVFTNAADSLTEREEVRYIFDGHPEKDVRLVSTGRVNKCLTSDEICAQNVDKVAVEPLVVKRTAGNVRKKQANVPWVASRHIGVVHVVAPPLRMLLYWGGQLFESPGNVHPELVEVSEIHLPIRDQTHCAVGFRKIQVSGWLVALVAS
jgi:hypothetical protein